MTRQKTSEKHHWERFWEESQDIQDVYDTGGRVVDALLTHLQPRGARVLEVGAGSGRDSIALRELGAEVWVVDYTPKALQLIGAQRSSGMRRVCGNAFQLPFGDGSFDAVFHQGLLEHFRKPIDLLRENARVLRSGGVLLVDVPQRWHYYTPLKHALIAVDRWFAGWETEFSIGELRGMLQNVGLRSVHEYGAWCVPNLFYRVLRKALLRTGVRLPLQPPMPLLGALLQRLRGALSGTRLPLYTGMNIGCLARKG
jgi:SAM-dependent methyltransferase